MAIDANTGEVLYSSAGDDQRYPASLTKMMTLYLAFEAIEQGRTSYAKKIKVSQEAASAAPTKLDLDPGEEIALIDAMKALITKSANDMAIAIAEHLAGSEARFAQAMTDKARAIGMNRTTFRNASGLPDGGQVTTARDMLMLAMRLQDDFPKHYPLFALKSFTYNGSTHRNHNTLLGNVEGVDGIKTGYTRMSGYNLVTSVRRGEKHVVAAVFGGVTAGLRNMQMRLLLTRVLPKASTVKTRKAPPMLIARPKLAPRPAPAAPPPPPVAVAAAPAKAVVEQRPAAPARKPVALADANAAIAPEPPPRDRAAPASAIAQPAAVIEIAKVRRVMVAPRVRPAATRETREPTSTDERAGSPPAPAVDSVRQPSRIEQQVAEARAGLTPITAAPRMPQSAPPQVAVQPPQPAPPLRAAAAAPASVLRGAQPSTLQAQADNLARGGAALAPATAATTTRPMALGAPGAATGGAFLVQIGAFNSPAEADRALSDTRERAGDLIGTFAPVTAAVQKENRQFYRARFAGFDAQTAASTCLELRRRQIDCFVMKSE